MTLSCYRFPAIATLLFLSLIAYRLPLAFGWGADGHRFINEGAISHLPSPLKSFYLAHKQTIAKESVTPDLWKESDLEERSRHYIDLDSYGHYPFPFFPMKKLECHKKIRQG